MTVWSNKPGLQQIDDTCVYGWPQQLSTCSEPFAFGPNSAEHRESHMGHMRELDDPCQDWCQSWVVHPNRSTVVPFIDWEKVHTWPPLPSLPRLIHDHPLTSPHSILCFLPHSVHLTKYHESHTRRSVVVVVVVVDGTTLTSSLLCQISDPCSSQWYGVTCEEQEHFTNTNRTSFSVTSLWLYSNNLQGPVPPWPPLCT